MLPSAVLSSLARPALISLTFLKVASRNIVLSTNENQMRHYCVIYFVCSLRIRFCATMKIATERYCTLIFLPGSLSSTSNGKVKCVAQNQRRQNICTNNSTIIFMASQQSAVCCLFLLLCCKENLVCASQTRQPLRAISPQW